MAFPQINHVKKSGTASNLSSFDILYATTADGVTYTAGDLFVCIAALDGGSSIIYWPTSSDWETNELYVGGSTFGNQISWRVSDGTEIDSVVSITNDGGETMSFMMIHITGWDSASDPASSTDTTTTLGTTWESRSVSPAWDETTIDTTWLAWAAIDQPASISTYPVNMTDNNDSYAPGSNNPSLGICSLESATASLSSTAKTSAFSASDYHRTGMMAFRGTAVGSGSIIPQIMHNRRMQQG